MCLDAAQKADSLAHHYADETHWFGAPNPDRVRREPYAWEYRGQTISKPDVFVGVMRNLAQDEAREAFTGEKYAGMLVMPDAVPLRDGFGHLTYASPTDPNAKYRQSYLGVFSGGKITGHGRLRWSDGSEYKGGIRNGELTGYGIYKDKDGDRFAVNYLLGSRHPQAVRFEPDGSFRGGRWSGADFIPN